MRKEYESRSSRLDLKGKTSSVHILLKESFSSQYIGSELYFGQLEDGQDVAVKFSRITGGAKREYSGLILAHTNGIKVTRPISIITREEEPKEGIIMDKAPGKTLTKLPSSEARYDLGEEVRKMHEISLPGFGVIENGVPQFDDISTYTESWINKVVSHIEANPEGKSLILELWNETKSHVLQQEPKFLQRDVNENNVIVDSDRKITLIDFEWWQGGDPMDDLATYLYHNIRQDKPEANFIDFLKGYTQEQGLTENQKLDLLFHTALAAGRVVRLCAIMNPSRLGEAQQDFNKTINVIRGKLK